MSWSKTFTIDPHNDFTLGEQIDAALIPASDINQATTAQLTATRAAAVLLARSVHVHLGYEVITITASGHSQILAPESMPDSMSVSVYVQPKPVKVENESKT